MIARTTRTTIRLSSGFLLTIGVTLFSILLIGVDFDASLDFDANIRR